MANAGTVTIDLDANSVKLIRELMKAQRATKKTAGSMRRNMKRAFAGIKRGAKAMTAALAVAVFAVARLTTASLKSADAIGKQADKLGIATEALAGMQLAAEITGSTQESLVKGLTKMQKAIVDGAAGMTTYTRAFDALNLRAKDLIKLSPDQQFRKIAESLKNVNTQTERVAAFADIFGARNSLLLNLNADALDRYSEQAERLGLAMSRWDVRKIEEANDALLVAKRALTGIGNSMAIAIAPMLKAMADRFVEVAGSAQGFREQTRSIFRATVSGAGSVVDALLQVRAAWAGIKVTSLGVLAVWQQAAVFDTKFAEFRKTSGPILLSTLPSSARDEALAENALLTQLRKEAEAELFKTVTAIEALTQTILDSANVPTKYHDMFLEAFDAAELLEPVIELKKGMVTELTAIEIALESLGVDTQDQVEIISAGFRKSTMTITETHTALKKLLDTLLELGTGEGGISLETYNRALKKSRDAFLDKIQEIPIGPIHRMRRQIVAPAKAAFEELDEFSKQAARNMQDAFAEFLFDPFKDGLKGMLKGFIDVIRRMLANQLAAQLFKSIGGVGGFIGAFFGGGKAHGGAVSAGTSYLVGEQGPELFTPGNSGVIIPNNKLQSSGTTIVNYNIEAGADIATIMSTVIPALEATQRSTISEIHQMRLEGVG